MCTLNPNDSREACKRASADANNKNEDVFQFGNYSRKRAKAAVRGKTQHDAEHTIAI